MASKDPFDSDYEAVDLQDESLPPITSTVTRGCYTIESDDGENSIEDSDEDDACQHNDRRDNDLSEGESSSSSDDYREEGRKRFEANSAGVTEVVNNALNNSQDQHPSSRNNSKRSIPSISPFQNIGRRLPSYMLRGGKNKGVQNKDHNGHHQRLPTTNDGMNNDEENSSNRPLMKEPVNSFRDPTQYPIEQHSERVNGEGEGLGSYSYATSDPSDVHYTPKSLRKMGLFQYDDLQQKKRKIICFGLLTALFICSIIGLSVFIAHLISRHVTEPPESLANLCDISSISAEEGHQECERLCQEAKCCMAPDTKSCFKGQEEICSLVSCSLLNFKMLHKLIGSTSNGPLMKPINFMYLNSEYSMPHVQPYIQGQVTMTYM